MFSRRAVFVVLLLVFWKEGTCCSQTNVALQNGQVYTFTSLNYPSIYPNTAHSCTFQGTAPVGQLIYVYCDEFNLPYDEQCNNAPFYISPTGDTNYADASIYCGTWDSVSFTSTVNRIAILFVNNYYDPYRRIGKFRCYVATWSTATTTAATTARPPTTTPTTPSSTTPPTPPSSSTTPRPPSSITTSPTTPTTTTTSTTTTTTTTSTTTPKTTTTTSTTTPKTTTSTTTPKTTTSTTTPKTTTSTTTPRTTTTTTAAPALCDCGRKNVASRIVGGQETSVSEYPWMVGLLFVGDEEPYCGGALIDNEWVLTASHCVQPFMNTGIEVALGAHELGPSIQSGRRVQVIQKIIHEQYDLETVDNDIALLKLAQPVSYTTNISPVCLPFKYSNDNFVGMMATATGWGTLVYQGNTPVALNEVDVPIISQQTCASYHAPPTVLTNNMFCTLEVGKDACQGDSGGPLTITSGGRLYEVGVISWGIECATPDKPGVYAKVTNYLQWIENKTGANFCKV